MSNIYKSLYDQARGAWQAQIVRRLVRGETIPSAERMVRGKAKNFVDRYRQSFVNLLRRLEDVGAVIDRTPGPRGGEWGATYQLRSVTVSQIK